MRTPWKIKFNDQRTERINFIHPIPFVKTKQKRIDAFTYLRGVRIPSSCLNKRISVFNGKLFKSFVVRAMMIGRKLENFV